jgi:hypothetical protein
VPPSKYATESKSNWLLRPNFFFKTKHVLLGPLQHKDAGSDFIETNRTVSIRPLGTGRNIRCIVPIVILTRKGDANSERHEIARQAGVVSGRNHMKKIICILDTKLSDVEHGICTTVFLKFTYYVIRK